jgi:hypothetical protein
MALLIFGWEYPCRKAASLSSRDARLEDRLRSIWEVLEMLAISRMETVEVARDLLQGCTDQRGAKRVCATSDGRLPVPNPDNYFSIPYRQSPSPGRYARSGTQITVIQTCLTLYR